MHLYTCDPVPESFVLYHFALFGMNALLSCIMKTVLLRSHEAILVQVIKTLT